MSWTPMLPAQKGGADTPVTISIRPSGGKTPPTMSLTVRPKLCPGLTWWTPGAKVAVMAGAGEHLGMIRITPGDTWTLRQGTGIKTPDRASLALPVPPGAPAAGIKLTAVEFDYGDDWLEITLPAWSRTARPATTPMAIVPPTPAAGPAPIQAAARHTSIMARTEDPAVKLQRQQGGRVR